MSVTPPTPRPEERALAQKYANTVHSMTNLTLKESLDFMERFASDLAALRAGEGKEAYPHAEAAKEITDFIESMETKVGGPGLVACLTGILTRRFPATPPAPDAEWAKRLNLPWGVESVRNADAEYGEGDESHRGFDAFQIVDAKGRVLFDSLNRDPIASAIQEDHGEDSTHAWDGDAKRDAECIVAAVNGHAPVSAASRPLSPDTESLTVMAALLRLFKGEYRNSGDRHSDALFAREGYQNALETIASLRASAATGDKEIVDWLAQCTAGEWEQLLNERLKHSVGDFRSLVCATRNPDGGEGAKEQLTDAAPEA